jgi:hypothetical protein
MIRKDVVHELERRADYLQRRIDQRVQDGMPYQAEGLELAAVTYAVQHLRETPAVPDERCRKLMRSYRIQIEPVEGRVPLNNGTQLMEDAVHLEKFSKTGFASGQFKAGIIAEFIRTVLLRS